MQKAFYLLLLFLVACSSSQAPEETAKSAVCDIEYTKYQATVTGYCQESMAALPESIPTIEKEIEIKPLAKIPEVFWFNEKMKYSLIAQENNSAPLIYVIAGTGASYESAKMIALQKALFQQGYHVLSLSSPTFSNFIINSTTRKDIPGDLERDAETLYSVMEKVLAQVKDEDGITPSRFSLTGYSLGGAHSAFIAKLDEEKKVFNFEDVLLINPPVSLYNSVSILDNYLDLKNNRDASIDMLDRIFDGFSESYAQKDSSNFTPDSIYEMFEEAHLTEDELKLLIGASFRLSSSDMFFAIDATYNLGALTHKDHNISKFESLTHSMFRAHNLTFTTYFEKAMVPWSQKEDPSVTREQLIHKLSLIALEDYLRENKKIHMVTNADDIILKEGEVEYLADVFGERAKIFPRGGHCGNMDRVSFVNYLQEHFKGEVTQ